jgi:hypothetical protein
VEQPVGHLHDVKIEILDDAASKEIDEQRNFGVDGAVGRGY